MEHKMKKSILTVFTILWKKNLLLVAALITFLMCTTGCGKNSRIDDICQHRWTLEMVSDLEGNILETGSDALESVGDLRDVTLQFNEDYSFVLLDNTDGDEYSGVYELEETSGAESSYMLRLTFDNGGPEYVGVYGTREYDDHSKIPSIIFQTDDRIISFLGD